LAILARYIRKKKTGVTERKKLKKNSSKQDKYANHRTGRMMSDLRA